MGQYSSIDKTMRVMKMKKILAIVFGLMLVIPMAAIFVAGATDTEPNDDFWDAVYVYDGDTIFGSLNEITDYEDYYQIWLNNGDDLTITFSGTGDDFDLYLYDEYEFWVDDSTGAYSFESIWYQDATSGYYYIVLEAVTGTGDYTLSITVTSGYGGDIGGGGVEGTGVGAPVPDWSIGDGWAFGNIVDIEDEMGTEIKDGLQQLDDMGFETNLEINGGLGVYFGIEVIDDDVMIGDNECYNVEVAGGFGIDLGIEADVDGSTAFLGSTISVDGKGDGFAKGEVILEGNMYFTTDQLAIAKIDMTMTAELKAEVHIDATVKAEGETMDITADASIDVDDVEIVFQLTFDPPIKLFDFPIKEGDVWYVPHMDTEVTGVLNAKGTITTDISATIPGEPSTNEKDTINLATEIGNNNFFEVIPGGPGDWYGYGGGAMFTCTDLIGENIYVIETNAGDAFSFFDMSGTRQFTDILDPTSLIGDGNVGVQYDASSGFITGATMDGEVMTETVTMDEVKDFTASPQAEVADVTGGAGGSSLFGFLLLIIIVVVVVVIIVVVVQKNKKPQQPQYAPPQQQYAPQQPQYYEQPPAPPQQQPQQYPPQDQQPPPPPPPQG